MDKRESEFEEGKQVEEYLDASELEKELNSLEIPPEANSEAEQRMENVVEAPVRNEKKKETPQKEAPWKVAEPPTPLPVKQPEPVIEKPKPPEPQQPQPVQAEPEFKGLDDYIDRTAEAVKQQWRTNAYRTLIGVVTGQLQVVQPQAQLPQQSQQTQSQPQVQQPQLQQEKFVEKVVVKDNSVAVAMLKAEVEKLNDQIAFADSKTDVRPLNITRRLLIVQIQKLEGTAEGYEQSVKYTDKEMTDRYGEEKAPVSAKVVKPQKAQSNVTPKVALALVGLFLICGIGIILVLNSVFH